MPGPRGWEHSIGIGLETYFGQIAAPTIWLPGECSIKRQSGLRELNRPVGEWDDSRITTGPTVASGGLTVEVQPGATDMILRMLARRTKGIANPHRQMNSVTIVDVIGPREAPVEAFAMTGVCVNTATFKCASGEDLVAEFDTRARERYRLTSVPRPAFATAMPAPYVFEEMVAVVSGAPEYHIKTVELAFNHNLADDDFGSDGTGLVRSFPVGQRGIVAKVDHSYEHGDLWDQAYARLPISLGLTFTRTNLTPLTISLPLCYINDGEVEGDNQPLELWARKPASGDIVAFTPAPSVLT